MTSARATTQTASAAGSAQIGPQSLLLSLTPTSPTRKLSTSTPWSPTTPKPSPTSTATTASPTASEMWVRVSCGHLVRFTLLLTSHYKQVGTTGTASIIVCYQESIKFHGVGRR